MDLETALRDISNMKKLTVKQKKTCAFSLISVFAMLVVIFDSYGENDICVFLAIVAMLANICTILYSWKETEK